MMEKEKPRVRFNWGFHDGNAAAERGRVSYHSKDNHPDKVYAKGWRAGFSAYRNEGKRTEDSESAWKDIGKLILFLGIAAWITKQKSDDYPSA